MQELKRQIKAGMFHDIEPKVTAEDAEAEGRTIEEVSNDIRKGLERLAENGRRQDANSAELARIRRARETFLEGCGDIPSRCLAVRCDCSSGSGCRIGEVA